MSNHKAMLALIVATPVLLASYYGPSRAEIVNLKADLKGSEETPPSTSAGAGAYGDLRYKDEKADLDHRLLGIDRPGDAGGFPRTSRRRLVWFHQDPRHCEPQSDRGLRDFDQANGQGLGQ